MHTLMLICLRIFNNLHLHTSRYTINACIQYQEYSTFIGIHLTFNIDYRICMCVVRIKRIVFNIKTIANKLDDIIDLESVYVKQISTNAYIQNE